MTIAQQSEISPAELVQDVMTRVEPVGVVVVVGPASDAQMQAGVASIVDAGLPVVERYAPVVWTRTQVRCLGATLSVADRAARAVQRVLHGRERTLAQQAEVDSEGVPTGLFDQYLIHLSTVTAGPSMHYDSPETWETLLFAEIMIGTEAVLLGVPTL